MEGVKDNNVGVSEIGNVAELIRKRRISKQKQRTSVIVSSKLVLIDARYFRSLAWTDLSQQSYILLYAVPRQRRHFPIMT